MEFIKEESEDISITQPCRIKSEEAERKRAMADEYLDTLLMDGQDLAEEFEAQQPKKIKKRRSQATAVFWRERDEKGNIVAQFKRKTKNPNPRPTSSCGSEDDFPSQEMLQESERVPGHELMEVKEESQELNEEEEKNQSQKPDDEQKMESIKVSMKNCINCNMSFGVATKVCRACGVAQPMKQKLQNKIKKYDATWASTQRENRSISKLFDETNLLLHKWQQVGMYPLFLLGRKRGSKTVAECLCPITFNHPQCKEAQHTIRQIFVGLINAAHSPALSPVAQPPTAQPSVTQSSVHPPVTQYSAQPPAAQPPVTKSLAQPPVTQYSAQPPAAQSPIAKPIVQQPVTQSSAKPPVTQSLAQPPVTQSSAQPPIAQFLAKPRVTQSSAQPPVAQFWTQQRVTQSPAQPPVAKSLAQPPVTQSSAKPLVAQFSAQPRVTKSSAMPPVAQSLAQPPVTQSSAQPPVVQFSAQPRVTQSSAQTLVAQSPAQPPVTKSSAQPPVTQSSAQPLVTQSTTQPPVAQSLCSTLPTLTPSKDLMEVREENQELNEEEEKRQCRKPDDEQKMESIKLHKWQQVGMYPLFLLGRKRGSKTVAECLCPITFDLPQCKEALIVIRRIFVGLINAAQLRTDQPPTVQQPVTSSLCSTLPNLIISKDAQQEESKKLVSYKECTVHPAMDVFPYEEILEKRIRQDGECEVLIRWAPCPGCGLKWSDSWELEDNL
ncbi:cortactin-binding protein 2-like isoform X2 [Myxocyprinus asiaticus]|uniref:cortactin-binding protein 2-like isoform X2 n=1 Tax=Myxocyprinus asiaticus TaxID=70543 RepID=UPI0022225782|nr:cortactin-binding protein 2-like isoform X2 [Myxocyprinus asiaticus]